MRTFPIFVSVERKPPLVTGGGELAAIKARLLLKSSCQNLPTSSAPDVSRFSPRSLGSIRFAGALSSLPRLMTMRKTPALPRSRARWASRSMFPTSRRYAASSCRPSSIAAR